MQPSFFVFFLNNPKQQKQSMEHNQNKQRDQNRCNWAPFVK